jgi:diguanylate cyclase (GGDEF)-like protein/putative nucleotidyltransferase with HDIG domain
LNRKAKSYITAVLLAGLSLLAYELAGFHTDNVIRFLIFFAVTLGTSSLKVRLPGVTGAVSVHFVFVLAAIAQLSLPEVLVSGVAVALAQCYWKPETRPNWIQAAFNVADCTLAFSASYATYHLGLLNNPAVGVIGRLMLASIVLFLTNTGAVAVVIGLTENKSPYALWKECYFWCFPYYLVAATLVAAMGYASQWLGWFAALSILPVVQVMYRSYRLYFGRLESEKKHAEQMAALHLRTIEALALAIDAKDHTTHDHLQRVQVYALETGKELGLSSEEMQALQAASLLHDIGKLAVPEHIISKPGKLTPEEFEKMKIHPVVGAEILERVEFPYAVAPIVRSHHEKWNGTGYPDGLKGEAIPIGARILSAVDCLDALASDRQYRRALPLDEAMQVVVKDSGKAFDPRVVEVLERRYREFEQMAHKRGAVTALATLSTGIKVERGEAPAAGFEKLAASPSEGRATRASDPLGAIASARHEVQSLYELAQAVGDSLRLSDTLSLLAGRIKLLAPYDSLVVYLLQGRVLMPAYVTGEDSRLFSSLSIPMGEGLSGWVAESRKPIVNGNPSVEPGYLKNPGAFSRLNSALAVPLEDCDSVIGVLALYHSDRDAYSRDQLRVLQAVSSKLTAAIVNSLKHEPDTQASNTDELTALPNARALFLHLDAEIARCMRTDSALGIVVCDIDAFKLVNDRHGHLTGDQLLLRVGPQLRQSCRGSDYVARVGGDEFVIVMPDLGHAAAEQRMRDFDRIVREAGRSLCGEDIVSLSCGCVHFPADGVTAEQLLAEGDRRMYKQKQEHQRSAAPLSAAPLPAAAVPAAPLPAEVA